MGFAFFFFDKFEINSSLVGSRTQSPLTFWGLGLRFFFFFFWVANSHHLEDNLFLVLLV
jgi:hypothetical protein